MGHTIFYAEKYAECSYWALTSGTQAPSYFPGIDTGFQVRPAVCNPDLPQTPHRAGIHTGMGDGSVRLFSPLTSPSLWYRANTLEGDK
jgi:hypothetical protein